MLPLVHTHVEHLITILSLSVGVLLRILEVPPKYDYVHSSFMEFIVISTAYVSIIIPCIPNLSGVLAPPVPPEDCTLLMSIYVPKAKISSYVYPY